MKKQILILLLISLFTFTLCACNQSDDNERTTLDNTSESTTSDNSTDAETQKNNVIPTPCGDDLFGGEDLSFNAGLFAQYVGLSWGYTLNITVDDGKIFLNDILYENAGTISNPTIVYNQALLQYFELEEDKEEKSDVLEKIKNSETCYVLETQADSKYGQKIAVYYIDGVYYFLNSVDGMPSRIHCAIVNDEIPPANNDNIPAPNGNNPFFDEAQILFVADFYAGTGVVCQYHSFEVKVLNGQIFLNENLFDCTGLTSNTQIVYDSNDIWSDVVSSNAAINTLEQIKNSQNCYLLENKGDLSYGRSIAVYYIDSAYYFVTFFGNGDVMNIYYAGSK